jgi:hypothetical protein
MFLISWQTMAQRFNHIIGNADIDSLNRSVLRVFVECQDCDINDFKQNIKFVDYVRDQKGAAVYILITDIKTGGGTEYSFFVSGQEEFLGKSDTLRLSVSNTNTAAEVRNSQIKIMKAALLPYVVHTRSFDNIDIVYSEPEEAESERKNNWNNWVFDIGSSAYFSWDQNYTEKSIWNNLSIIKINQKVKTEWTFTGKFFGATYEYDSYIYKTENRELEMDGLFVGSLSDHWSLGFQCRLLNSTFSNYQLSASLFPSLEFNIFPYSKSTRRQLSLLYGVGITSNNYIDTTIFAKTEEHLFQHKLSLAFKVIEKWGNISLGVQGSNYFVDWDYNRLTVSTDSRFRLFKGLFFKAEGGVSVVHDQINLSAAGIDYEQVLLQQKEILSAYYYWFQVGLNFTFGDVYNSIVNPRFTQLF